MRNRFDEQLNVLNSELVEMGALCEYAISGCVKYLITNDEIIKDNVLDADSQIDQKERDIERLCMKLLMQQQPVASDLRVISAALKMISDMERIGDQASDIVEIAKHSKGGLIRGKSHIEDMARETIKMVTDSVDSFVKKNVALAESVIGHDAVVDKLFDIVKSELIKNVKKSEMDAETSIDLLMVAKYFERIGDHAENIADWVIYSVTGKREIY